MKDKPGIVYADSLVVVSCGALVGTGLSETSTNTAAAAEELYRVFNFESAMRTML